MTPLLALLCRRIARSGPISVADFMAAALSHPEHGYYTTRDPLGAAGDFTTAPEISQMFGELIGLWCGDLWQRAGSGRPLRLAEFGPGRGTLLADACRALTGLPGHAMRLELHLIEISAILQDTQRQALTLHQVTWHNALDDLPDGPLLMLANEFYDALPTRQFLCQADGWHERLVGLGIHPGELRFVVGPPLAAPPPIDATARATARPGQIVEASPARIDHVTALSRRLVAQGGALLIVDYGPANSGPGDSLQGVRSHRHADLLAAPGRVDLTTHVDFAALAGAARAAGARVYGPTTQRSFLRTLGIEVRAAALMAAAVPNQRREITAALDRLIGPTQMGTLFKVLAITGPEMPVPAGFV